MFGHLILGWVGGNGARAACSGAGAVIFLQFLQKRTLNAFTTAVKYSTINKYKNSVTVRAARCSPRINI